MKGRSISTSFFGFSNETVNVIDKGGQIDVIYLDFSKAFDKVSHPLLLEKLYNIEIRDSTLKWIISYFTNRYQAVKFKGAISDWFHVTSGVTQGS